MTLTFLFKKSKELKKIVEFCKTGKKKFYIPYTRKCADPHLVLVKDVGVYLMAGCVKKLLNPEQPGTNLVAYAEENGPETYISGDDFVEMIPLECVNKFLAGKKEFMAVILTDEDLKIRLI